MLTPALLFTLALQLPPPVHTIPLDGDTFHVQGLSVENNLAFITSVHRETQSGWLFLHDPATGARLRALPIHDGPLYHPGGFDSDSSSLWIPVAEYRPKSRSVIQRRDKKTLALLSSFPVPDHIGALAVAPGRLYGANWDSRQIYEWSFDGTLLRVRDNPLPARIQDLKFRDGLLVAAAVAPRGSSAHEILFLDPETLLPRRSIPAGFTSRHVPFTNEGLDLRGVRLYLLPEDTPSRLFVFLLP